MEFTVTKEQIEEIANWGNPDNKKKLKEWFPKAFKTELEAGKWYKFKFNTGLELMSMITEIQADRIDWFGFRNNIWRDSDWSDLNSINQMSLFTEATPEEIQAALIAEAKKRGYKGGVRIIPVNEYNTKLTIASDLFKITERGGLNVFNNDGSIQFEQNTYACLYASGKWAEILPKEKTIITKGKALRIIAKKLKVSPEQINFVFDEHQYSLDFNNSSVRLFCKGKSAEIPPEQKTIITVGKALNIIAKKLKVSPDQIEIQ